jgi:hypothetical protein
MHVENDAHVMDLEILESFIYALSFKSRLKSYKQLERRKSKLA